MAAGTAAATALGIKIVDKILQDKGMSFEEKLNRLEKLKASGEITND